MEANLRNELIEIEDTARFQRLIFSANQDEANAEIILSSCASFEAYTYETSIFIAFGKII